MYNVALTPNLHLLKKLSTPASLRSDRGWPVSIGTSGRFGSEQPAGFSGIGILHDWVEVGTGGLYEKMIMIVHEHIGM